MGRPRALARGAGLLLLAVLLAPGRARADGEAEAADLAGRLRAHVEHLAGRDLHGRGAWEDRVEAAAFIAGVFEAVGLEKAPGQEGWWVDQGPPETAAPGTPAPAPGRADPRTDPRVARNVLGWWCPGGMPEDGTLPEYVILSAHYDHLGEGLVKESGDETSGTFRKVVRPGADDNASGVAALLEVARRLASTDYDEPPARAVLFVAFDLEEQNLLGSRRWAADPPVPLEGCVAFLTMDQMGRSLADLTPGALFVMGGEHAAVLAETVAAMPEPEGGRKAVLGIDFQPPTGYSDYVGFQEREVPFLFVSSGACADYHQPSDVASRIDVAQLAARTTWVADLVERLAFAETAPTWRDPPPPQVEEIATLRDLILMAEGHMPDAGVPAPMVAMVAAYRRHLDELVAKGTVTELERRSVRTAAHTLFQQAVQLAGGR